MDRRSAAQLTGAGYDPTRHRARQFAPDWPERYDLVLAMDQGHLRDLRAQARRPAPARRPGPGPAVPGLRPGRSRAARFPTRTTVGTHGFEEVLTMVERTSSADRGRPRAGARARDDPPAGGGHGAPRRCSAAPSWPRPRSPAATSPPPPSCGSSDGTTALMKTHPHPPEGFFASRGARAALAGRGRRGRRPRGARRRRGVRDPALDRARQAHRRRRRGVRPRAGRHPRRRRPVVRRGPGRLHRPAAAAQRAGPDLGGVLRDPPGAALPQARPRPRRGQRRARRRPSRPALPRLTELVPEEPPARLHGDLWNGNVLWGTDGRVWRHRPGRARRPPRDRPGDARPVRAAAPAPGRSTPTPRPRRSPTAGRTGSALHQLFPLLVHACLFGGGYAARAADAAAGFV